MQKVRYESVAQAMGAFVAAEFEACLNEPSRLLVNEPVEKFDMFAFEQHLVGLLSDIAYCATLDGQSEPVNAEELKGPVVLVYAMREELWNGRHNRAEWQACAQGYVRMEGVA